MSKDAEQTPVIAERPKPLPWWLFPLWRLAAPVIATATLVPAVAVVLLVVVWLDLPMLAMVPAVTGLMVFGAVFTTDRFWALLWITISLCGLAAAAPAGWSIPSLIAPRGGNGTVGGIMNFLNSVMGITSPIVTGFIVLKTGSFSSAFVVAGVVLVIGIFFYVFVLGRIEPVPALVLQPQDEVVLHRT